MSDYSLRFEDVKATAEQLQRLTKHRPQIGVVCGSGLGGLVDILQETDAFDYKDIPHFPVSTGKIMMHSHILHKI